MGHRHGVEPGPDGTLNLSRVLRQLQETVLGDFLGVRRILEYAVTYAENQRAIALGQCAEGEGITSVVVSEDAGSLSEALLAAGAIPVGSEEDAFKRWKEW